MQDDKPGLEDGWRTPESGWWRREAGIPLLFANWAPLCISDLLPLLQSANFTEISICKTPGVFPEHTRCLISNICYHSYTKCLPDGDLIILFLSNRLPLFLELLNILKVFKAFFVPIHPSPDKWTTSMKPGLPLWLTW